MSRLSILFNLLDRALTFHEQLRLRQEIAEEIAEMLFEETYENAKTVFEKNRIEHSSSL